MSTSVRPTPIPRAVAKAPNPLKALNAYGQSVWLDYMRRSLITSGELQRLIDEDGLRGEDLTEPAAKSSYPHPPVSHEPRIQQLSEDFARLGLKPFHVPLGIQLDEKNPHANKCIRYDTCDGFPCLVYAKSDAQVLCVDPALQYTLLTNFLR